MDAYVTVDIGGTHIRAATFLRDSTQPIKHQRTSTHSADGALLDRISTLIETVWPEKEKVKAISVASPGPLDPKSGVILATPNIPEWRDFPLGPKLADRFGVPVYIDNDANLAALGEWRYGAGKGYHDVLYLTISTGIGGGVIVNDQLLRGARGMGAELGHVTVLPDGPLCSCGQPGHLEALASGPAIVRFVREQLAAGAQSALKANPGLTARQIAEAAGQGDALARQAFQQAGEYLGLALASLIHIFDPSIVIFGGGVSQSGRLLFDPMKASLRKYIFHPAFLNNLAIKTAALGDDAGLLGALALAKMALKY